MRITLDLDNVSGLELLTAIFNGTHALGFPPEVVKSRRGFHLVWRGLSCSYQDSIETRRSLGDDPRRLGLDELARPSKPRQVLFTIKRGRPVKDITRMVHRDLSPNGESDSRTATAGSAVDSQHGERRERNPPLPWMDDPANPSNSVPTLHAR